MQLSDLGRSLGDVSPWHDRMWPVFLSLTLGALARCWRSVATSGIPMSTWHENQFSAALFIHLSRFRDAEACLRILEFQIESRLLDEHGVLSGIVDADASPRIDILVRHAGMARNLHLCCETKILTLGSGGNRRPADSVRAYVDDGMRRFVEEKYGTGTSVGVMLGIIIEGLPQAIAKKIGAAVLSRRLPFTDNLTQVTKEPACEEHYRSSHPRPTKGPITLEHLLFSIA